MAQGEPRGQRKRGSATHYDYDDQNRVTDVYRSKPDDIGLADDPFTSYVYDVAGNVVAKVDGLGNTTEYDYDALGRLVAMTLPDPDGSGVGHDLESPVTYYGYDALGQLTSVANPLNSNTVYAYDLMGRRTSMFEPDAFGDANRETQYVYDDLGRLIEVIDPLNNSKWYAYDNLGRLVKETQADPATGTLKGASIDYAYDVVGQLVTMLGLTSGGLTPTRRKEEYGYDKLGRRIITTVSAVEDEEGYEELEEVPPRSKLSTFDVLGRLLTEFDEFGNLTRYRYDALGRQTMAISPRDGVTRYTYDAVGNRTSLTDPVGNTTSWTYDRNNRQTSDTNALFKSRTFVYDEADRLISQTDRNGRETEYEYDNIGRRTDETWVDGLTPANHFEYSYDAASQLLSARDDDSGYSCTYDLAGNLKEVGNWIGAFHSAGVPHVQVGYTYDNVGRVGVVGAVVGGDGDYFNVYERDELGRIKSIVQDSLGGNVTYKSVALDYTANGRFSTIESKDSSDATVAISTYSYDPLEQLTSLVHRRANDSVVSEYYYSYDLAGRIASQGNIPDGFYPDPNVYSYNGNGELYSIDKIAYDDDVPYVSSNVASYVYDRNGNRVAADENNIVNGIGANNQLLNDGVYEYAYDDEGNLISKTTIAGGAYQEFHWDYRNRLTEVVFMTSSSGSVTKTLFYSYDVNNQLIGRDEDTDGDADIDEEQHFIYDGNQIALVLNHDGEVTDRMLWGPAVDQLLSHEVSTDPLDPSTVNWTLGDHQGTIENWVDDDGVIVGTADFDEFGRLGSNSGFGSIANVLFGFTGKSRDADTGQQRNGERWYDPLTGRWSRPDPSGLGPDVNSYRYTGNDPVNFTDPTGLDRYGHPGEYPPGYIPPAPSPPEDVPPPAPDPMSYFDKIIIQFITNPVGRNLFRHYAFGHGATYNLSVAEASAIQAEPVSVDSAPGFWATKEALIARAKKTGKDASGPFSGNVDDTADLNYTLGNFVVHFDGTLKVKCDESWSFKGTMHFKDVYDFDPKIFDKDSNRSWSAEFKVDIAYLLSTGTPFKIDSSFPVTQTDRDLSAKWAGKWSNKR